MKQVLEVGDRVKLMNADFVGHLIGVTGVVHYVSDEPNDDGNRAVSFVLSDEDRVRLQRVPGFMVTTVDANLKYLKPEKADKAAKLDDKFAKKVDKLGGVTMKGTATKRETELVVALSLAVAALDVLTYATAEDPLVGKIKKAMLAELR